MGNRVILGALTGIVTGILLTPLAFFGEPDGGYTMGRVTVSAWGLSMGYLVTGLFAGGVVGAAKPVISSAGRAGAVGAAIAAPVVGGAFLFTQEGMSTTEWIIWTLVMSVFIGGGIGAAMYWMLGFGQRGS